MRHSCIFVFCFRKEWITPGTGYHGCSGSIHYPGGDICLLDCLQGQGLQTQTTTGTSGQAF